MNESLNPPRKTPSRMTYSTTQTTPRITWSITRAIKRFWISAGRGTPAG